MHTKTTRNLFFSAISKTEPLPKDEQLALAQIAYDSKDDPETQSIIWQKLCESNMRYIIKLVLQFGYAPQHPLYLDAIQEASLGFLESMRKFKPGSCLPAPFALFEVRHRLLAFVLGQSHAHKGGLTLKGPHAKAYWKVKKIYNTGKEVDIDEMAERCKVKPWVVRDVLAYLGSDLTIDLDASRSHDGERDTVASFIPDSGRNPEQQAIFNEEADDRAAQEEEEDQAIDAYLAKKRRRASKV